MKKMTRRLFVLAISLLMLVGCMSGCGKGGELDIHEGENDPNVPQLGSRQQSVHSRGD